MRSPAAPRLQTPRSSRDTQGPGVRAVARAKGGDLMPWQSDAVDVALEVDGHTGLPWYQIVVVTVQRQSGKTKLESDVADHRCLVKRDARVWYTAQTGKDASAWMRDEHFPSLERATLFGRPGSPSARYTRSKRAGQEGIDWRHGSTFRVFPPLRDALHGKQSDLVFLDEAWALSAEQGADVRQAIRPTMATRRGAQLWIVSTMGTDESVFFDGYVDLARAAVGDPNARVCLIDYGLRDDDDPEDLDVVASRHPAYGYTIDMDALVAARSDFGADVAGWVRAYGNRPTRTQATAIPANVWAAAGRSKIDAPDRVGLALDVTPDLARGALSAGWRSDLDLPSLGITAGDGLVELVHAAAPDRAFVDTIAAVATRRRVPIVADRGSVGALEVLDALARHYPEVEQRITNTAEYATACVGFDRGIWRDEVHHFNQPALDSAVTIATKRPLGDGAWGWGRKASNGSIAELVSASLALQAFDRLPAAPSFVISVARR